VALVSIIVIPVSILSSLLILSFFGVTINVMVLAGLMIAIGAIVDDSIIDVENIIRRVKLLKDKSKDKILDTVFTSSLEVRSVIIYVSVIEIIALVPVFFLDGLSGAFFFPLAGAYVIATLISMFVALTLTPALIMVLLSSISLKKEGSPLVIFLKEKYKKIFT
jgi:Cu/Ag efflux pump CusA